MGGSIGRLWKKAFGKPQVRVLLLGLDNAGKTTILYALKAGLNKKPELKTEPTVGFNVETVQFNKNLEFVVWDVSGQDRLRNFWRHYYRGTAGIVFVVDSKDRERFALVKKELHGILKEEELKDAALLLVANKQDLPDVADEKELTEALSLDVVAKDRNMKICPAVAVEGMETAGGLRTGFEWLEQAMPR